MKPFKTALPTDSLLHKMSFDYSDCFALMLPKDAKKVELREACLAFMSGPKWIEHLMNFRNRTVSIFGLKTGSKNLNREFAIQNFKGEIGERLGLFQVFDWSENEIIIGENDKHLDFRVSILIQSEKGQTTISLSTIVCFHNWFGKMYFLPVQPFHKLIVPAMLRSMAKALN